MGGEFQQPEVEQDNVFRGLELAKNIAGEHEAELRDIIQNDKIENYTDPITEGPITTESLIAEFEERATAENIDLKDFYEKALRQSVHGHKFEALAMIQIMMGRKNIKEKPGEE